tara:strand:- start:5815 stop:7026 length:1212 start_codon:yes stop_codon:yes gene_type:complete
MKKKVAFLLGSMSTIPKIANSNTPARLISATVPQFNDLEIFTISKWDNNLINKSYDESKYLHVNNLRLHSVIAKFISLVPGRLLKEYLSVSNPDRIIYYYGIYRILKQIDPDIIITHLHLPLLKFAKFACPNKKHIFYFHGSDLHKWPMKNIKYLSKNIDGLVTICKSTMNKVDIHKYNKKIKTQVIYNGVDPKIYNREKKSKLRATSRSNYDINKDDLVIIYAGRIHPSKGIDILIDTFNQLVFDYPKLKLLIVGSPDGIHCDPNYYNELKIQKKNKNVIFTGKIEHSQMINIYSLADIAILLSREAEGNSMFILESMACGLSVIATNVGGLKEIITNEQSGLLVDANQIEKELKVQLFKLIDDKSLRENLGGSASERIRDHFTEKIMSEKLQKYLHTFTIN